MHRFHDQFAAFLGKDGTLFRSKMQRFQRTFAAFPA